MKFNKKLVFILLAILMLALFLGSVVTAQIPPGDSDTIISDQPSNDNDAEEYSNGSQGFIVNFFNQIVEMFGFSFFTRAVIVGLVVSLCAALLGVNLVLKRYAMIGTGLSHVGFGAMVIAEVLGLPALEISIAVVIACAFLLLRLKDSSKISGDSGVAMVSVGGLAVGIVVMGLTTGITMHICDLLFGNILAVRREDLWISIGLGVAVILIFIIFYKQLFSVTFDEDFASATGTKTELYKTILALLTAITVVIGMRIMGALLISSLILFPALSAMRICKKFLSVVVVAAIVGVSSFLIGMIFSYMLALPPGACVVAVNIVIYLAVTIIDFIKKGGKA